MRRGVREEFRAATAAAELYAVLIREAGRGRLESMPDSRVGVHGNAWLPLNALRSE